MSIRVKKNYIIFRGNKYKAAIGSNGFTRKKREGDLSTPYGFYSIENVMYRHDKIKNLSSKLPLVKINKNDGWCDEINHPLYNTKITFPFGYSAEHLYRKDSLYDIVCVLNYNTSRIIKGRGSAIFLHIATPNFQPTAGCIAIQKDDLCYLINNIQSDENKFIVY